MERTGGDAAQPIEMSPLNTPDQPFSFFSSSDQNLVSGLTLGLPLPALHETTIDDIPVPPPDVFHSSSGIGIEGRDGVSHLLCALDSSMAHSESDMGEEELSAGGCLLQSRENSIERVVDVPFKRCDESEVAGSKEEIHEEEPVCPLGVELNLKNELKGVYGGHCLEKPSPAVCAVTSQAVSHLAQNSSYTEHAQNSNPLEHDNNSTEHAQKLTPEHTQILSPTEYLQNSVYDMHDVSYDSPEHAQCSNSEHTQYSTPTEHAECSTSTFDHSQCSTSEQVQCSTSDHVQCSTSDHVQCSTPTEHVQCSTSTSEQSQFSTSEQSQFSTSEHVQCSTSAEHVQCSISNSEHAQGSTSMHAQCSTSTEHAQCSTSTSEHAQCSTSEHAQCSTSEHAQCLTSEHVQCSTSDHAQCSTPTEHVQCSTSTSEHAQGSTSEHAQCSTSTEHAQCSTSTSEHAQCSTSEDVQWSTSEDVQWSTSEHAQCSTSTEHVQGYTPTENFHYSTPTEHALNVSDTAPAPTELDPGTLCGRRIEGSGNEPSTLPNNSTHLSSSPATTNSAIENGDSGDIEELDFKELFSGSGQLSL